MLHVAWSVCLCVSGTRWALQKRLNRSIEMPFGMQPRVSPRNVVIDWVHCPDLPKEGELLRGRECRHVSVRMAAFHTVPLPSARGGRVHYSTCKVNPDDCKGKRAEAMWPIAKLLWPLVIVTDEQEIICGLSFSLSCMRQRNSNAWKTVQYRHLQGHSYCSLISKLFKICWRVTNF